MRHIFDLCIRKQPRRRFHFGLILLIAAVSLTACGKKSTDPAGNDKTPPRTVTDLRVVTRGTTAVTLQWTAPGDDDTISQVTEIDVRYSSSAINSGNFAQAAHASIQPLAQTGGSPQLCLVGGLTPGNYYYFAMRSADDQDNWSGISNCVAASCLTDQVIAFPDTALERLVRERIGKPSGDIYKSDVDSLEDFTAQNAGIINLNGLREFVNLRRCDLTKNNIEFLIQLQNLAGLTSLALVDNDIIDLAPLAGLTNLQALSLGFNPLTDINPLAGMINMLVLDLSNLPVKNYAPVSNMTKLRDLRLASDSLDDLSFVIPLSALTVLNVGGGRFTDISPVVGLTNLTDLKIASTPVVDIVPLTGLTKLRFLNLENNAIVDILPLVNNTGLGAGDEIALTNNPLSATSINTYIPALQARGVTVHY